MRADENRVLPFPLITIDRKVEMQQAALTRSRYAAFANATSNVPIFGRSGLYVFTKRQEREHACFHFPDIVSVANLSWAVCFLFVTSFPSETPR